MEDYTLVEAKITCACCGYKDILNIRIDKNQDAASAFWRCPDCHAERTITVKKAKPIDEAKDVEPTPVKYYKEKDGRRIEVDEDGNPKDPSSFLVSVPKSKKKSVDDVPFKVGKIE